MVDAGSRTVVQGKPALLEDSNFDARIEANRGRQAQPTAMQSAGIQALAGPTGNFTFDEQFGVTRTLSNPQGYLTAANQGRSPLDIAMDYVQTSVAVLGLEASDLTGLEVTDIGPNPTTGSTHAYLRQTWQGIPVFNAQLQININREGHILSVNNSFVPMLARSVNLADPSLVATDAVLQQLLT